MFLRSDYDLMLDNELKMAAEAQRLADSYTARAEEETNEWYRVQAQNEVEGYLKRAERHRENAQHWMILISAALGVSDATASVEG